MNTYHIIFFAAYVIVWIISFLLSLFYVDPYPYPPNGTPLKWYDIVIGVVVMSLWPLFLVYIIILFIFTFIIIRKT